MTVFKTFFKVLMQYKGMVILYTVMLVAFATFTFTSGNSGMMDFSATKPDILIINHDENSKLSQALYSYMEENANIKNVESIDDALFYRDISYVIEIPKDYAVNFMSGKNPSIEVKANGDYNATYANMLLEKFLKVASTYRVANYSEEELCEKTATTLKEKAEVKVTSTLDTSALAKTSFYYSFLSYSLLAGCVFIIAMAMSSFKDSKIRKRMMISSTKTSTYNKSLFLGSCVFGFALWAIYVLVSFILLGSTMMSINGLLYILNSFVFMICCLAIAFLIGNAISNKEAIGGIVNVVALGSSFLCGAFVPMSFLPESVLTIAKVIPTYWYVQNNELISKMEVFQWDTIMPLVSNALIVVAFTIVILVINNIITKKRFH